MLGRPSRSDFLINRLRCQSRLPPNGCLHQLLHILAVDDQPELCEVLVEYLRGDCHRVITARDGEEALHKVRYENSFDLIITAKAMLGMSGDQLAGAIRELRPDVPIMLLTGSGQTRTSTRDSPGYRRGSWQTS